MTEAAIFFAQAVIFGLLALHTLDLSLGVGHSFNLAKGIDSTNVTEVIRVIPATFGLEKSRDRTPRAVDPRVRQCKTGSCPVNSDWRH